MDRPDGLVDAVGGHDDGDIPLGRTLRRGPDRNAATAQGGQHTAGGTAVAKHVVADQAYDGETGLDLERLEPALGYLPGETGVRSLLGARGIRRGNGDAHGMDGRSLGDQDDVDPGAGQGVEQAGREARNAHHAAAFQRNQGDVVRIGDAQHVIRALRGIFLHQGAAAFGIEGVLDIDRNPLLHDRLDGRRIDDLRPEMGQFLRRAVGNVPDGPGGRDDLRIGRHDAGDIGPDLHQPGADAYGEQRRGIIGAAAPEGADPALCIRSDETRHDEQGCMPVNRLPHVPVRRLQIDLAVADPDDLPGIQPFTADAQRSELREDDLGREQFAVALDGVQACGAELAQQEYAPDGVAQFAEKMVNRRGHLLLEYGREQFPDDGMVAVLEFLQQVQASFVPGGGLAADLDQGIGAAADGGADDDGTVLLQGLGNDAGNPADGGGCGNGRAAEFQYLHSSSRIG